MNLPRLIALFSLLLVMAALAFAMFSDPAPIDAGTPRTNASRIPLLTASVPPIGDFDREFNVNVENPFIPVNDRAMEKRAIQAPRQPRTKPVLPAPGPVVIVDEPVKPKYPTLKPQDSGAPECLGVIRKDEVAVLVACLPGQEKVNLEVGKELGGWKLTDIAVGSARFTDPAGMIYDLPIGGVAPPPIVQPAVPTSPKALVVPPAAVTPHPSAPLRPGPNQGPAPRQKGGKKPPKDEQLPEPAPEMVPLRPKPK